MLDMFLVALMVCMDVGKSVSIVKFYGQCLQSNLCRFRSSSQVENSTKEFEYRADAAF